MSTLTILDHVYDHEAAQPDRVFLTQPQGGGQLVDFSRTSSLAPEIPQAVVSGLHFTATSSWGRAAATMERAERSRKAFDRCLIPCR